MPPHPLAIDGLLIDAANCEVGMEVITNDPRRLRKILLARRKYLVKSSGIIEIAFLTIRTPPAQSTSSLWLLRNPDGKPRILRNFYL